jgi:hypothetical protein
MNRAQLFQHFDTLADTPQAVARLRNLVLSLAPPWPAFSDSL